ncbi:MAG TPA: hypothetical protein PKC20_17745, partial [Burkholderiaceae bacterium]|nr:hypothetical protein [Burkholderiaceae bacterium]
MTDLPRDPARDADADADAAPARPAPDRRRVLAAGGALALGAALPAASRAQAGWPSRPIRFIVPFPAGGGADLGARVIDYQRKYGYRGRIHVVNPRRDSVAGLPCHASPAALPEVPDL